MNLSDANKNSYLLRGSLAKKGYMRWWHSFSGIHSESGETRTFFVEIMTLNPALYSSFRKDLSNIIPEGQPILGQHPFFKKRGLRPSYVMIKAGIYPDAAGKDGKQLHAFYPISELRTALRPFVMEVDDCFYSEERIRGYVEVSEQEAGHPFFLSDAGTMEWDLEVYKAISCNTGHLSHPFAQWINLLDSYWHGEGIKSYFRGTVTLDGETYEITPETSHGYADKHWGHSFNRPWFQLSCGNLTSQRTGKLLRNCALAINGCCPRFLWFPLRHKLLIQLTYTGEDFEFGRKPFLLSACKWETKSTNKRYIWHILAQNKDSVIKISGSCTKEVMLQLKYESPEGILSKAPLLSGAAACGTIQLFRRREGGRELLDTLQMQDGLCMYRAN